MTEQLRAPELSAVDVLTTTRTVRLRLDLSRGVERGTVLECIDVAAQAPSAMNLDFITWLVVEEPEVKNEVARIFRWAQNDWAYRVTGDEPDASAGSQVISADCLNRAMSVMPPAMARSVMYLREHIHEVPTLVFPLVRVQSPGPDEVTPVAYWGSVLPAMWSFMLALRTKGLGSAWTCVHLDRHDEMGEVLGVPPGEFNQPGLIPVAHTLGTDFKRASRPPRTVFLNSWGTTG